MNEIIELQELFREFSSTYQGYGGFFIVILFICAILKLAVDWLSFEQGRQLCKLHRQLANSIGERRGEIDQSTKFILSDFKEVRFNEGYMLTLVILQLITTLMGLYSGYILTAIFIMLLNYFPIWKLMKSDGLTATELKRYRILTKILFIWTCIKAILVVITFLSVVFVTANILF